MADRPAGADGVSAPDAQRAPGQRDSTPHPLAGYTPNRVGNPHASPLVRRFARQLGVDLRRVDAQGPGTRILKQDVEAFVRRSLAGSGGAASAEATEVAAGRAELFDLVDSTALDEYCRQLGDWARRQGIALSPLPFVVKAVGAALPHCPALTAAADATGIGVRIVDGDGTRSGLIADPARLGITELAQRLADLAEGDAPMARLTIIDLTATGGAAQVAAPGAAALALSRADSDTGATLRLGLSYDTALLDTGAAAGCMARLVSLLGDIRQMLL